MSEKSQNKKLTKLTITALCQEAARNAPNEDHCLVITGLGTAKHSIDVSGRNVDLEPTCVNLRNYGCLLVVADGMGGMNAGEIASEIAVQTIREFFISRLKHFEPSRSEILKLMREAIVAADEEIVNVSVADESKYGMGTTVALLWIFDNKAYYAWCGDSRIYLYRENNKEGEGRGDKSLKLQSLSLDHSYVMAPKKKDGGLGLDEDEAFSHSMNNVIMRSLGNPSERANPDVKGPIEIYQDDVFLLCSDGLCGAMRTSTIQQCIDASIDEGIGKVRDTIWGSAPDIPWHDNMTTLLCHVTSGPKRQEETVSSLDGSQENSSEKEQSEKGFLTSILKSKSKKDRYPDPKPIIIAAMTAVVVLFGLYQFLINKSEKSEIEKLSGSKEFLQERDTVNGIQENNANAATYPVEQEEIQENTIVPDSTEKRQYTPSHLVPSIRRSDTHAEGDGAGSSAAGQSARTRNAAQTTTPQPTPQPVQQQPKTQGDNQGGNTNLINQAKNKNKQK